jgi:hypothetical protein
MMAKWYVQFKTWRVHFDVKTAINAGYFGIPIFALWGLLARRIDKLLRERNGKDRKQASLESCIATC